VVGGGGDEAEVVGVGAVVVVVGVRWRAERPLPSNYKPDCMVRDRRSRQQKVSTLE
jgi:hypothetical protein